MKLVINNCFGGFSIDRDICNKYNLDPEGQHSDYDCYEFDRTNKKLIELIESGIDCNGDCAELVVVEIPDEATDYRIEEYDGAEEVLYVIDGKIHVKGYMD